MSYQAPGMLDTEEVVDRKRARTEVLARAFDDAAGGYFNRQKRYEDNISEAEDNRDQMKLVGIGAVVAGFVVVPAGTSLVWVPALAYGTGVVLDKLDGVAARTVGDVTVLGRRLDMAFDTFGFVVAPLVAVLWGQLPVWYLSLSAARFVYRGGIAWRQFRSRPLFTEPDSDIGRYLAGVQMVFLTVALAPVIPTWLVWAVAPFVLVPSLLIFSRDFLTVSGRLSTRG